jgi:hypothetical protein
MNRASVRPDAPLLDHDASLTTHAPSFLQKKLLIHLFLFTHSSSYHSYPLTCRLRAHGRWPSEAQRAAAPRHTARPLALPGTARACLQVAALGCQPCQARCAATLSKSRGCGLPAARAADASLLRQAATAAGLPPTSAAAPVNTTH